MTHEIKMTFAVKTFQKENTAKEMLKLVSDALWAEEKLRDIQLIDFSFNNETPIPDSDGYPSLVNIEAIRKEYEEQS